MVDEHSADSMAMRSTFFIDPQGIIRAITCYPYNVGRSGDEMLRLLKALQAASDGNALVPEGWRHGEALLELPTEPGFGEAEGADWFCRRREAR